MTTLPEWAQALIFCVPFLILPGVIVTIGLITHWRHASLGIKALKR